MERMLFGDCNDVHKGDIAGAAEFPCKSLTFMDFLLLPKSIMGVSFVDMLYKFHMGSCPFKKVVSLVLFDQIFTKLKQYFIYLSHPILQCFSPFDI